MSDTSPIPRTSSLNQEQLTYNHWINTMSARYGSFGTYNLPVVPSTRIPENHMLSFGLNVKPNPNPPLNSILPQYVDQVSEQLRNDDERRRVEAFAIFERDGVPQHMNPFAAAPSVNVVSEQVCATTNLPSEDLQVVD